MKKIKLNEIANTSSISATDKMTLLTAAGLNLSTIETLRKALSGEGNYAGDLNVLLDSGVYLATTAATNMPTGTSGGVVVVFNPRTQYSRIAQFFLPNTSAATRVMFRYKHDSGFNPWKEVAFL